MRKQLLRMSLLAAVFTVLLCVGALAEEPTMPGIYYDEQDIASGVTVTPGGTPGSANIGGQDYTFYSDAEQMSVTLDSTQENTITDREQYVIFVTDAQGVPTEDNLVYINQEAASGNAVTFSTVYPSKLEKDKTYYVYITGGTRTFDADAPVAVFQYYEPYTLGDVDGNKLVTVGDVTRLMQYLAKMPDKELTGVRLKAADADRSGQVTVGDVTKLMQYLAGIVTTL